MKEGGASRSRSSRVYRAVRTVLLALILVYLAWQIFQGRSALASLSPRWDAAYLGGALLSALAAYQCLVLGWLVLLRRSGYYDQTNLRHYVRIWWVSYLYRYVPGKVLLVVERSRLGLAVGIPPAAGAALTIVETLLAILAGSAVSLLAVSYYTAADGLLLIGIFALSIGVVFLFPAGFRLLCRAPFFRSRYPELKSVAFGSRDILLSVLPYILHYLLLGLSFLLVSHSLRLFDWSSLAGLCGIYALSHVVSLIAWVAPGGLGVREGALAVQLGRILPTGIGEALAIGIRIWFTLAEMISYFGVLLLCPRLPTDKVASGSVRGSNADRLR